MSASEGHQISLKCGACTNRKPVADKRTAKDRGFQRGKNWVHMPRCDKSVAQAKGMIPRKSYNAAKLPARGAGGASASDSGQAGTDVAANSDKAPPVAKYTPPCEAAQRRQLDFRVVCPRAPPPPNRE